MVPARAVSRLCLACSTYQPCSCTTSAPMSRDMRHWRGHNTNVHACLSVFSFLPLFGVPSIFLVFSQLLHCQPDSSCLYASTVFPFCLFLFFAQSVWNRSEKGKAREAVVIATRAERAGSREENEDHTMPSCQKLISSQSKSLLPAPKRGGKEQKRRREHA